MQIYSAMIPVKEAFSKKEFVRLLLEWNQGSPHDRMKGVSWDEETYTLCWQEKQRLLAVEDLPEKIKELQKERIKTYAAHLRGENAYDEEDYTTGCAFLIGNEGNGLRDEVADCADCLIRIPMEGEAESLNAAVAAAVLMFEAGRQRRKK